LFALLATRVYFGISRGGIATLRACPAFWSLGLLIVAPGEYWKSDPLAQQSGWLSVYQADCFTCLLVQIICLVTNCGTLVRFYRSSRGGSLSAPNSSTGSLEELLLNSSTASNTGSEEEESAMNSSNQSWLKKLFFGLGALVWVMRYASQKSVGLCALPLALVLLKFLVLLTTVGAVVAAFARGKGLNSKGLDIAAVVQLLAPLVFVFRDANWMSVAPRFRDEGASKELVPLSELKNEASTSNVFGTCLKLEDKFTATSILTLLNVCRYAPVHSLLSIYIIKWSILAALIPKLPWEVE